MRIYTFALIITIGAIARGQECSVWTEAIAAIDSSYLMDSIKVKQFELLLNEVDLQFCPHSISAIHRRAGIIQLDRNESDEALTNFRASLDFAERSERSRYIAASQNMLGKYYNQAEQYDSALIYFMGALDSYSEDPLPEDLILAHQNIAATYLYADSSNKAREHCHKMLDLSRDHGTAIDVATAYQILELIDIDEEGATNSNIYYLRQCLEVFQEEGDDESVFNIYENIGFTYKLLQEYDSAITYYQLASDLALANGSWDQLKWMNSEVISLTVIVQQLNTAKSVWIIGLVALVLVVIVVAFLFVRNRQHMNTLKQERINSLLQQQELIAVEAMLEGQEKERKHIAEELHDRLGGTLAAAKLMISSNVGTDRMDKNSPITKIQSLIDETAKEVRRISQDLNSVILDEYGLAAALMQLNEVLESVEEPKIHWFVNDLSKRLSPEIELNVYRIVQETLGNSLKHADAKNITVQLLLTEDGFLNLTIEDDGVGFDARSTAEPSGLGLRNLETRVERLSGKLNIDSTPGKGTSILVDIPVEQ